MDTSPWYNLNPKIKITRTNRKFYQRYLHKIVYRIPGISVLRFCNDQNSSDSLKTHIARQLHLPSDIFLVTVGDSDFRKKVEQRYDSLVNFIEIYTSNNLDLRFRLEGHNITIFAASLEQIYDLAIGPLLAHRSNLIEVCTVQSQREQQILEQDCILVTMPTQHPYRVILRGGIYQNHQERQALANYLKNLGDQVKITKNILANINSSSKYINAGYFHVRDPDVVGLISLIMPTIVRSVRQLVVL